MVDYLDKLSQFVADTDYEDLSPAAVAATKDVILDTIGAIVAGSELPENAKLARTVVQRSGPAAATIMGHPLKAEPMLATLVNATAGVALEMDEGNRFGGGHPSIHVTPGAIAVAEEMGASGQQLIEAVLVGYEVSTRIGRATKTRFNVHSHGHWGTFATAAAVAKLKGYNAKAVRGVINVATGMSPANSWTAAFKGATVRNLYPGRSGLMGILASHAYECGFTGVDDAPADLFGIILGEGFDRDLAVEGLGSDEYRIQQNYFKFYACCRINHPSLDAILSIQEREPFAPEEVESIDLTTRTMLQGMLGDYPKTMLAAKFNVPYAVAATAVRGTANVTSFYDDARADARIKAMVPKVHIHLDPSIPQNGPLVEAAVRLKNGRVLKETTLTVRGDHGNRMPRQAILDKFHFLNDHILGKERASQVITTTERLDQLDDVRALTRLVGE
ncbi:MAG: MmgE/PrpD family protein [Chloroflexi bacterium]|nr:MmgE/PrpD family protein [Chloroflexota bacterium]